MNTRVGLRVAIFRKSMICGITSASPAVRISVTRDRRPGTNRSWLSRRRGPLATSRMPVASSTIIPGPPRA
jgi:hypothetical protein